MQSPQHLKSMVCGGMPLGGICRHARGSEGEVTVGSDSDFRNGRVLAFYVARMDLPLPVRYLPAAAAEAPAWYLSSRGDLDPIAAAAVRGPRGFTYRHAATFPHAGFSGGTWLVYRRADPLPR
jgi:hypothetical protein